MANFKTHITTSSLIGVGIGAGGWLGMGIPVDHCLLAGGLCGLAGMLPDLDSPNSVPVREVVALSAALVPALMIHRFEYIGLSHDQIVLAGALIYFGIRFGISAIFKRYTVHRGMWHSIPAAMIAALLALMICSSDVLEYRLYKAIAVFIGFISHLVLDEIYSIDLSGMKIRVKKSSGTALKFWSGSAWANFSTYAKLALILFVLSFDSMVMTAIGIQPMQVPEAAQVWLNNFAEQRRNIRDHLREVNSDGNSPHLFPASGDRMFMNPLSGDRNSSQTINSQNTVPPAVAPPKYERPQQVLPIERWPQIEQSRTQSSQQIR